MILKNFLALGEKVWKSMYVLKALGSLFHSLMSFDETADCAKAEPLLGIRQVPFAADLEALII